MLTPAHNDPNRKAELKRKNAHPETFSSSASQGIKKPDDWKPSTGLKSLDGRPLIADPRTEATKAINVAKEKVSGLETELEGTTNKNDKKDISAALVVAKSELAELIGE